MIKRILTLVNDLVIMLWTGQTEAGSVEVQPARDSQFKAMNCRWGGSLLPSRFMLGKDNSELCHALKKPVKKAPPRAVSVSAEGSSSLKIKCGFVQFTLNQYTIRSRAGRTRLICLSVRIGEGFKITGGRR